MVPRILVLLALLVGIVQAGDFDPPTPRITLLKPARELELAPGGQARVQMMGSNLELFRYGQVMREKQNQRAFKVHLEEPSSAGAMRSLTVEAGPDAAPGAYELRLFTPLTSVALPLELTVVGP
ncbi:MAG: hypothetical protein AMXMBFR33_18960 [Candidatus Xenobia bacterium]